MGNPDSARIVFHNVVTIGFMLLTAYKIVLFADAAIRPERGYRAADKKNKGFWLIILGLSAAIDFTPLGWLLMFLSPFSIAGLIAAIVYQVDARPAVRAVAGGRGRGRDNRDDRRMGPYGPW